MTRDVRIRSLGETVAIAAVIVLLMTLVFIELRRPSPAETAPAATTAAPAQRATPALPPTTRAALDAGNTEFRAKQYAAALGHYRLAALSSPGEAAPFYGIYMAAQALNNRPLADSAVAEIRGRTGGTGPFNDTSLRALHGTR